MAKQFRLNLLRKARLSVVTELNTFFKYYARYIIILTQLVVLSVFFIKIILDQTVIDLKEGIDQKNEIILTAESMITSSNTIVDKTLSIDTILTSINTDESSLVTTLTNIPQSVTLEKLTLRDGVVELTGQTFEPSDIQRLQLRLQNKLGKKIQINSISQETNVYVFELVVTAENAT